MPGKENIGIICTVAGGYISTLFGFCKVDGFNLGSFIVAVIGAVVV
ncbi:GlsB/YeaQ/YmgE family stress response membrane protein [Citrobacter europaeus]|nr:GlsB/YeaQ/YmgE family stress response membrane protein [Citrobacter europaeus]